MYTLAKSNDIEIRTVKYSYNQLDFILKEITEYIEDNIKSTIFSNMVVWYISLQNNNIVLFLKDASLEKINEFKTNISDSEAIKFMETKDEIILCVNLNPGTKIRRLVPASNFSMGYRVRLTSDHSKTYLLTTGHGPGVGAIIADSLGANFGVMDSISRNGYADAGLVRITNSNYTLTNIINGTTDSLSTTINRPGVGTVLNKVGFATGHSSGSITSTTGRVNSQGILFKDLIVVSSMNSAPGDSGGPAYTYHSTANEKRTVGIVMAKDNSNNCYIVKSDHAQGVFGVSRY